MLTQTALLKAIKYCGSKQKKLADLIGEDPDKISYWLNRAKQVPFHHAIAIESATNGLVSRYDLAPYARSPNKKMGRETTSASHVTISERVAMGISFEKSLGNRRGKRNDLLDGPQGTALKTEGAANKKHGRKCAQVTGKTSALVAKEVGFNSRDTYLRAKKVIQNGIFTLVQAMDKQTISISNAAAIAELPPDEQAVLLEKNKKEIAALLRAQQKIKHNAGSFSLPTQRVEKMTGYFVNLLKDEQLINAEKKYKLPLRLPLLGLLAYCDAQGHFPWEPQQLKNNLLPYVELNLTAVLETLALLGYVRKIELSGEIVHKGHPLA